MIEFLTAIVVGIIGWLGPAQLLTNEYAYRNPSASNAIKSNEWIVESGSLFEKGGRLWTGVPDRKRTGPWSLHGTNSSVFRAISVRRDFRNVAVRMHMDLERYVTADADRSAEPDGVFILLRYESAYSLYYVSVAKRDSMFVIKKKCPGGPSNRGTYYDLTKQILHVSEDKDATFEAIIWDEQDGSVRIQLFEGDKLVISASDKGQQHLGGTCSPIKQGGVGVRADNAQVLYNLSITGM